ATLKRGETVVATIERVPREPDVKVIRPLHRIPFAEGDRFCSVDITQDGRYMLAGRAREHLKFRVWDVQTGKLYRELPGCIARFTPDGSHVIATSWNDFDVYELRTGKRVRQIASQDQSWNFVLSPDGTRLLNLTPSHHEVYDWATGERLL